MQSSFTFLKHELNLEQGTASFFYELQTENQTYNFQETLTFDAGKSLPDTTYQILNTILDNLLLMLGISYWKTFCPAVIKTPTIGLTKDQANFWNTVYTKGLGEFFYKNQLDFHGLINFPYVVASEQREIASSFTTPRNDKRSLLLFGGGKDSIVSAELLKKHNKPFDLFIVNPTNIHLSTAEQVKTTIISFKRILDPQLLELNKQPNIYNGHVPATAMVDFIAVFAAMLYGYDNIIASNEHSANYGNVNYLGETINHQWSKTLEFEKMFQEYLETYITSEITYFSLLRPWYEIRIVKEFIHYPQYFPYFSSCNTNFKLRTTNYELPTTDRWCGKCPKCLFVFILLSAYLPRTQVLTIFNKNLYADYELLQYLRELLGIDATKPFECVGTPEETTYALWKAYTTGEYANDILIAYFVEEILPTISDPTHLENTLLKNQKDHTIPEGFETIVKNN